MTYITEKLDLALDHKKMALTKAVRNIIQKDVAGEVWYESKGTEEKLLRCLENLEKSLVEYISSIHSTSLLDILKEAERRVEELRKEHVDWREVESKPFIDDDVAGKVKNADEQNKRIRGFNSGLDEALSVIKGMYEDKNN